MPESDNKKPSVQTDKLAPDLESSSHKNPGTTDNAGAAAHSPEIEIGGRQGLEPTRFGDWEKNGRCTDF